MRKEIEGMRKEIDIEATREVCEVLKDGLAEVTRFVSENNPTEDGC